MPEMTPEPTTAVKHTLSFVIRPYKPHNSQFPSHLKQCKLSIYLPLHYNPATQASTPD